MKMQRVTCLYDGDSYVGSFCIVGHGDAEAVSVQFDGKTVSTRLGGMRPEFAARTLLGELVRQKTLGNAPHRSSSAA